MHDVEMKIGHILSFLLPVSTAGFAAITVVTPTQRRTVTLRAEWTNLCDGVKKVVLEDGEGTLPADSDAIDLKYRGTLAGEDDWTVDDVVECWLKPQQGFDVFEEGFRANAIDGKALMDANTFNDDFVTTVLGVSNRIQGKKLMMAARKLSKVRDDFPVGAVCDENESFQFELGKKRLIRGMDAGVRSMKVGEKAQILCRSDAAYGNEGLRKSDGTVIVPPFATLLFDLERSSSSS